MKKLVVVILIGIILSMPRISFSQGVPDYVYGDLVKMSRGEPVKCYGSLGHGNGIYNGKTFYWMSFENSDGWVQIAMTAKLSQRDISSIKSIKDLFKRNWDARIESPNVTWIGLSNDFFADDILGAKYYHLGKEKKLGDGRTIRPIVFNYKNLKRDYLDRITKATNEKLEFNVAELVLSK